MFRHQVRDAANALAYLTDCTLATVAEMASKKSAPKGEFKRQTAMAQTAIDWMNRFGVDYGTTRAREVMEGGGLVASWAEKFRPEPTEKDEQQ
jgi:hypothetical protein